MLNVTQYHHVNDVTRIFYYFSNSWWQRGSLARSKLSNFMWIPGLWFQKDLSQAVSWKKGWEPWREHSRLTCSLQKHILTQSSNLTAKFFQISSGSYGVLYYSKISEHKFQKFSNSASYNRTSAKCEPSMADLKLYARFTSFIKSILKSLVILAIWLALRGAIYSRIALFFALNRTFFSANENGTVKQNNQSDFKVSLM